MNLDVLSQVRKALGVGDVDRPKVMVVAERSDVAVVVIDQSGNRITIETPNTNNDGDRVIVSGGKILGQAESPSVTVWVV